MNRSEPGSSTLIVVLVLVLLSGSCLALLMTTQTQALIAAQLKLRARLLAAADGGLQLAVARGIAGAEGPYTTTLDGGGRGAGITVEATGFVAAATGACHLCMANLDGTLASLGGLGRVSHVAAAAASVSNRSAGLPPPRRAVSAVVDLMPWPGETRDRWDLASRVAVARDAIRDAALSANGAYDDRASVTVAKIPGPDSGTSRTVAVGGLGRSGRLVLALETAPRISPMWRFGDAGDEDGNEAADLGFTVSRPAIVPVRLGGAARFVAVFGGGFDPRSAAAGNWLYIVGIESGQLLYKRPLDAAVAAAPAAVDTNGDGLVDRLYAGTTAGSLYQVDLSSSTELEGGRVAKASWRPRRVFETGGLPIHQPPSVVPLPAAGAHALAFGAGGGADPAAPAPASVAGRFFVVVDRGSGGMGGADTLPALHPKDPRQATDRLSASLPPSEQGWSLTLEEGERPASAPLVAGGLLTFLTFQPTQGGSGEMRWYSLHLGSGAAADGVQRSEVIDRSAAWPVSPDLGSPVRLEIDRTGGGAFAALLAPREQRMVEALRAEMPVRCRFTNARLRVAAPGPGGSLLRLAAVPVCRIDSDWTETSVG